jgi:hypothetical protein
LLAALAQAGKEAGGGNAVVCFSDPTIPILIREKYNNAIPDQYLCDDKPTCKDKVTLIETLDLYLAKKQKGLLKPVGPVIIEPLPNETPYDFVERIAARFDKTASGLADMIRKGATRFPDDKITMEPKGVPFTPDSGLIGQIDNVNCVIATMAFQYNTSENLYSETDFHLHVDSRLFNHKKHKPISQDVLYLHEIVWSFERVEKIKACNEKKGETEACYEKITSRNSQLLVGYGIRETPAITLAYLLNEVQNLNFANTSSDFSAPFYAQKAYSYPTRVLAKARTAWAHTAGAIYESATISGTEAKGILGEISNLKYSKLEHFYKSFEVYKPDLEYECTRNIFSCDLVAQVTDISKMRDELRNHKRWNEIDTMYKYVSALAQRILAARVVAEREIGDAMDSEAEKARMAINDIPYLPLEQKEKQIEQFKTWKKTALATLPNKDKRDKMFGIMVERYYYARYWPEDLLVAPIDLNYAIP